MATQAKLQLDDVEEKSASLAMTAAELKPILEAIIYVAEEPIAESTLVTLLGKEHQEAIREGLRLLLEYYQSSDCGLEIKEVAGGYKMATKAEHHEWVRKYVKHHTPPTKLSLASLETLAVIAYRQPITVPEIQEVRGVNAVSVLKTLLDKKLITTSGRKNVIGRPILYRTTKEFLVHFGLKNLDELPSLEEFEDLARSASDGVAETTVSEEPPVQDPREEVSEAESANEPVSSDGTLPEGLAVSPDGAAFRQAEEAVTSAQVSVEDALAESEAHLGAVQASESPADSTTLVISEDSDDRSGEPS